MSFGKIRPTPNFLFNFPFAASSDRKFRNFLPRDTHKLIKCSYWEKNLKSGNIACGRNP